MIGLTPPALPSTALSSISTPVVTTDETEATTTTPASTLPPAMTTPATTAVTTAETVTKSTPITDSITDTVGTVSTLPPVAQSLSLPSVETVKVAATSDYSMDDMSEKYSSKIFSSNQISFLNEGVSVNVQLENKEVTFLPKLDSNQVAAIESGKSIAIKNEDGKNYTLSSLPQNFKEHDEMMMDGEESDMMNYVTLKTQDGQTRKAMLSPVNMDMKMMDMKDDTMSTDMDMDDKDMATTSSATKTAIMEEAKSSRSAVLSATQMSNLDKGISINIATQNSSITLIPALTSNQQAALQSGKNLPIENEDGKQYYVRSYKTSEGQSSASSIDDAIASADTMKTITLSSFDGETRKAIILPSMHSDTMKSMSSYTYQATSNAKASYSSLYA